MLGFDRRSLLAALSGLTLAPTALAQTPQETPPLGEGDTEFRTAFDRFGRLTASVMLNGQGPFDFMVDTGANSTVVAMRHAVSVVAVFNGMATVHGVTGSSELPMAQLSDLRTGAAIHPDMRVAVMPDKLMDADGVLGADAFIGKRIYVDIERRSVRVESSRRTPLRMRTGTRITAFTEINIRNSMLAEISGTVGRVPAKMMIDTGAQGCIANLALSKALWRFHPKMQRVERVRVTGATGHILTGDFLYLPSISMGQMLVRQLGAVAIDAPIFRFWDLLDEPALIVGMDVLATLSAFSIDYGSRRFEAKPTVSLAQGRAFA